MTRVHLLLLAQTYAEVRECSLYTVGKRATGGKNPSVFIRLENGEGIRAKTAALVAQWLQDHWPLHCPWPLGVPLHCPPRCAAE